MEAQKKESWLNITQAQDNYKESPVKLDNVFNPFAISTDIFQNNISKSDHKKIKVPLNEHSNDVGDEYNQMGATGDFMQTGNFFDCQEEIREDDSPRD